MGRMRLMPGDRGEGPAIARPPRPRFAGRSYESSSRTAADLIAGAHASGDWFDLPEALAELRGVMEGHLPGRARGLPPLSERPLSPAEEEFLSRSTLLEALRYSGAGGARPASPEFMGL